ncbi:hypothetical protein ACFPN1_08885 [Lysobacter yangpyeongensis]|uniref:STAS/SEC14 domain-containing protein n=1 Tax=Lysobacter yangpyeongensis TaxID=346182 RepID=A0ABW0SMP9_9GAMM
MIRDIRIFPEARRLELKFMGGVSIQDRLDTLALVAPLVTNQHLDRILINFSAAWHEPALDKGGVPFEDTLRASGAYAGSRVAFVSRPHSYAPAKGEGAASLGFEFRCFSGLHAALAWLTDGDEAG